MCDQQSTDESGSGEKSKIITIDGGVAVGKSTVSKAVARATGFRALDSGSIYRTITLMCIARGVDVTHDITGIFRIVNDELWQITTPGGHVWLNGKPVGEEIRTPEVSDLTPFVACHPFVRKKILPIQRDLARNGDGLVAEGRDMGSVVFPDAMLKVYLTASDEVRVKRRLEEYERKCAVDGSTPPTYQEVFAGLQKRDYADRTRADSPLVCPRDAITVNTDDRSAEQVAEFIRDLWRMAVAGIPA